MKQMENDILKSVLGQAEFRSTDSPNIENVPSGDLEGRRMSSRVEILFRSRMSPNDSRKLLGEIDSCDQHRTDNTLRDIPKA